MCLRSTDWGRRIDWRAACLAWLLVAGSVSAVSAQTSWEFSPYRVRLWAQFAPSCQLPERLQGDILAEVSERVEVAMGAAWLFSTSVPPAELASEFVTDLNLLTAESIEAADPESLDHDKLFLILIGGDQREFVVHVRELDCRTRTLGPTVRRDTQQVGRIAAETAAGVLRAFAAMVRIEAGEGRSLTVRVRAGGLLTDRRSPAFVGAGDVLLPIVRRNDRVGKPLRISVVELTFLQVLGANETTPNLLDVYVHSTWRSPIRGRVGSNREQYGLKVRPEGRQTELQLVAEVGRGQEPYALEGLEVYSRAASSDPPASGEESLFLGHTDWRGSMLVERGASLLTLIYIKSGGRLLARLPIVAGSSRPLRVALPDDDPRLQAEGTIQGFNSELMDLIAQRRILSAAIRRRLEEDRMEDAVRLMQRFNQLPSRADMQGRLAQHRRRQASNRAVQALIDRLYTEARTALKYIDPGMQAELMNELQQHAGAEG